MLALMVMGALVAGGQVLYRQLGENYLPVDADSTRAGTRIGQCRQVGVQPVVDSHDAAVNLQLVRGDGLERVPILPFLVGCPSRRFRLDAASIALLGAVLVDGRSSSCLLIVGLGLRTGVRRENSFNVAVGP